MHDTYSYCSLTKGKYWTLSWMCVTVNSATSSRCSTWTGYRDSLCTVQLDHSWIIYSLYPIVLASLFPDRAVSNIFAVCTDNHSPQVGAFTTRCAHLSLLGWLIFILLRAALRLHFIFNGQCILNWWDRAHFSHIPRKIHRKQSMRSVWSAQGQCTIRATLLCYPIACA